MPLTISEVTSNKDLLRFIRFQKKLYKGDQSYVPPLESFELSTLDSKKNPAFDHANAKYWLVKRGDTIVGRAAGIILEAELKAEGKARFGWIDFEDDQEVSRLLLNTISEWAKNHGASRLHGPMGFTDIDFEGALIEGFENQATQATIYNYPYYQSHYESYGLEKAVDWFEARGTVPGSVSKRLARISSICQSRFELRSLKFKRSKDIKKYAPAVFRLLNKSYSQLYGYYPLSERQIAYYTNQYFGFIRKEFISIIVNKSDDVVGMAISLPSISGGLQKANGRLFPFGFAHILKDFYFNSHLDLFLIGVDPEYQKLGAHAIIFNDLLNAFITKGIKTIATGPMLEENKAVLSLWEEFKDGKTGIIRRRCYIKDI